MYKRNFNQKRRKGGNNDYQNGKRWGFAVMSSAIQTDKGAVMAADKAMQTCARNARTGIKKTPKGNIKLTNAERAAYRGIADGMYESFRFYEKIYK